METPNSDPSTLTTLYMALELSEKTWVLGFGVDLQTDVNIRQIQARDMTTLQATIAKVKQRFGLAAETPVLSCYEAGRDGFWLNRSLGAMGIGNLVVDSSSIEVQRRRRRIKTDKQDVRKLLRLLIRSHMLGEREVWQVVNVPPVEVEDARQVHRELHRLKKSRTQTSNRINSCLVSQGLPGTWPRRDFVSWLEQVRLQDGSGLQLHLKQTLAWEYERYQQLEQQIQAVEAYRLALVRQAPGPIYAQIRHLAHLKGIGVHTAWLLSWEFFGWRQFRNRREVAALAGLAPAPHASGEQSHDQGITKAGNRFVRGLIIEIAWNWLLYQPESHLTKWYQQRYGQGTKRQRRTGIVALARRILVALWRYTAFHEVPEGAILQVSEELQGYV